MRGEGESGGEGRGEGEGEGEGQDEGQGEGKSLGECEGEGSPRASAAILIVGELHPARQQSHRGQGW